MATHDYVIANASGAAVRADLNNALAAIVSSNSNATEPATMYAYQWWADTSAGTLKLRNSANNAWITIFELDGTMLMEDGTAAAPGLAFASDLNTGFFKSASDELAIATTGVQRVLVDSSGNVGIGATSVPTNFQVEIAKSGSVGLNLRNTNNSASDSGRIAFSQGSGNLASTNTFADIRASADTVSPLTGSIRFRTNQGNSLDEAMRIDSSGRLLVGTSSAPPVTGSQVPIAYFSGNKSDSTKEGALGLSRGSAATAADQGIGRIEFTDSAGAVYGRIASATDAAPGSNDYPGRLSFHTTADGASSPTERMRIDSSGNLLVGNTNATGFVSSSSQTGVIAFQSGALAVNKSDDDVASFNRLTSNGTIVSLRQAGTQEGEIRVSGTTVSYVGGHLSRWSQTLTFEEHSNLLKGTVMTNLDEMCEWENEDNEQLNKMAISTTEGDPNVAGVIVGIDEDNDLNVGMTGDMVIRIAQGTTVARGDLLMSAGDGTAKPQDDDIVRSKTIAKVTSTTVSTTYSDNSYCVPCVLMAC